jgi:hypothetical protein
MATINEAGANVLGIANSATNGFILENEIDLTAHTAGATDVVQLINIPENFIVTGGHLQVDTPGSTNTNGQIGITGGDTDGFLTVQNLDGLSAAEIVPFDGAYLAAITGRFFPAADTIDMLYDTAADLLGKYTIRVWGFMAKLNV